MTSGGTTEPLARSVLIRTIVVPKGRKVQVAISWMLISTLRANGSVVPPLVILFLSMFPIRLGIYYFGYPAVGSDILWWSFPLSSLASLAMAWVIYKRGNWRRTLPQPGR